MKIIKIAVRAILKMIHPDLEYRLVDQYHFDQLKRKPPDLIWKALTPGPDERLDVGRGQIGHELFIFGGLRWNYGVVNAVDIFDMEKDAWSARINFPEGLAQSHLGVTDDTQRFIYLISGQLGGDCRPATTNCFVFDAKNRSFNKFPPLPKARYAPAVQIWRGRLHSIGGAKEDRNTPATDHWSIAVSDGKALEKEWKEEPPIPHGGHHRASAIINDVLYVFGGQEGDYIAIPGDPNCRCTAELTTEIRFPDTYRLRVGAAQWERMADMPILSSHTESGVIKINDAVFVIGGDCERQAKKDMIKLNDEIQFYDARADSWKVVGRLPYRLKTAAAGYYKGWLYITTGQRDRGPDNPTPENRFERNIWKAKFDYEHLIKFFNDKR